MKLIKNIKPLKREIKQHKKKGKTIGLIPSMGFLHKGHVSLIRRAVKDCDVVAMSIFVNPTQFGPDEDYSKYPRNIKRDLGIARSEKVDIVFAPDARTMYPGPHKTYVYVERMSRVMCGTSRPAHFRGVATIVAKLFNLVEPDIAYFGQKDAQQAIIINRMITDLNMNLKIKILPIIREKDGLAMSSRNIYLNNADRKNAGILYNSLKLAKKMIRKGKTDPVKIIHVMKKLINSVQHTRVDYISITDIQNLKPVKIIKGKVLVALAVNFGKIRLIDNIMIKA